MCIPFKEFFSDSLREVLLLSAVNSVANHTWRPLKYFSTLKDVLSEVLVHARERAPSVIERVLRVASRVMTGARVMTPPVGNVGCFTEQTERFNSDEANN